MSVQLSKHAYEELIAGDIAELKKHMPEHSLEMKHIIAVLEWSIEKLYPDCIWKRSFKADEGYTTIISKQENE